MWGRLKGNLWRFGKPMTILFSGKSMAWRLYLKQRMPCKSRPGDIDCGMCKCTLLIDDSRVYIV